MHRRREHQRDKEDEARLWRHVDGELPPAEVAEIEAAAGADPALARRIEEMRLIKRAVLRGAPEPSAGFADRVVARALQPEPRGAALVDLQEARRFLRRALVAAAILAALGLTYLAVEVVPSLLQPPQLHADPLLGGRK